VIEASNIIERAHQDEQLLKYTQDQGIPGIKQDPSLKTLATYLLTVPIEYRAGARARINELMRLAALTLHSAIEMTKSELDCQLRAPDFEVSDEETKQQRADLEYLLRYSIMAADDATSIQVTTMAGYTRNIVRAALATLLANKMIAVVPCGDWLKIGYPKHLM